MNPIINHTWWLFRIGLGLGAFLAGLDKFFNLLADWEMYLSPVVKSLLPVSGAAFMGGVGIIEMTVGVIILAGLTRPGGYVMAAWLVAIALNLLATGMFFDLAVRDLEIALGAYAMARLGEARQEADRRAGAPLPRAAAF